MKYFIFLFSLNLFAQPEVFSKWRDYDEGQRRKIKKSLDRSGSKRPRIESRLKEMESMPKERRQKYLDRLRKFNELSPEEKMRRRRRLGL